MKRLVIGFLFLALAGCGALQSAQSPIGINTVADARNILYATESAYTITLRTADEYVKLPACGRPASPPICSSTAVVRQMAKAKAAAKQAIDSAEEVVLNAKEADSVLKSAIRAATAAQDSFKSIVDVYKGG
jgi:hypothetical protein